jgi:hypothetical protein
MTYKITEDDRKLLTGEVLGECNKDYCEDDPDHGVSCPDARNGCAGLKSRTFTTDQDRTDLFRKLVELGKWHRFERSVYYNHYKYKLVFIDYTQWLFIDNPERACCLVAEFWREK